MKQLNESVWYYYRLSNKQLLFAHFGSDLANYILQTVPDHTVDWFKFQLADKFLLVTDHNPLGTWEMQEKARLMKIYRHLEYEYNNLPRQKPQFLIDDDDEYQDQLELGWHTDEILSQMKDVKNQLFIKFNVSL